MPFIDPDFLFNDKQQIQRILLTSADDCNVVKTSFELAKIFYEQGNSVLWINGNLGENTLVPEEPNSSLEKVLTGYLPLTEVIHQKDGVFVLEGISNVFFAELSEKEQYQFLQNLKDIYPNFDKVILAVDGKNIHLQKKWMTEAERIYLLFNTKNLLSSRTLAWLKEYTKKTKGLIGIGKNEQEVLLTYIRLKNVLKNIPELILDIKKIAP